MPVVHNREELLAVVNTLSERAFADGVLWDVPKARRREQAKNPTRRLSIQLDGDLKIRMATQINRYVEICGKAVGWELMLRYLEQPSDATLKDIAEGAEEAERPDLSQA